MKGVPPPWFRLDNAGTLFPSIMSRRYSTFFRISAEIDQAVDIKLLEESLSQTLSRFPIYQVLLRPGFFWYYFEKTDRVPHIQPESPYPCAYSRNDRSFEPIRIIAYNKRIAVEFSHMLSDGTGALQFLRTLLCVYFSKTIAIKDWLDIPRPGQAPSEEESQNAFEQLPSLRLPKIEQGGPAFHLPGKLYPPGVYRIRTGMANSTQLREAAKKRGCSVTEYICAHLLLSYQNLFFKHENHHKNKKPIRILVPVNLRPWFGVNTLRNFFDFITVQIDPRLGRYGEEDVFHQAHHQLRGALDIHQLRRQILHHRSFSKRLLLRLFPLFIKNSIIPPFFATWGETRQTSSLSNLGVINLPEEIQSHVCRIDFIQAPSPATKNNISVAAVGNITTITFASVCTSLELETIFFRRLVNDGVPIELVWNF